jgi:hypothetical protein
MKIRTKYDGLKKLLWTQIISEMAIQDIKIGIDWFFSTCKSYCNVQSITTKKLLVL